MKFLQHSLWVQYLQTEAKKHVSHLYGIVCRDPAERRHCVNAILKRVFSTDTMTGVQKYSLETATFRQVLEELDAYSLFSEEKILLLEGIEALGIKEQKLLAEAVRDSPQNTHVIWIAPSPIAHVYETCKEHMVLLDLSKEKPWDAKKRYTQYVHHLLQKAQKKIQPNAMEAFTKRVGDNLATWLTETHKLISYVGEQGCVQVKDVEAIVSTPLEQAQWKMAEHLVFEPKKYVRMHNIDMAAWFTFVTAVRYYLHMGVTLKMQIQNNQDLKFGKTAPSHLARNAPLCQRLEATFFVQALSRLFEMELQAKETAQSALHLYEQLELVLAQLRRGHKIPRYNSTRIGI